jgi:hypothetical protein
MESRMARISATSSRGEAGDKFASIIRRVPATSAHWVLEPFTTQLRMRTAATVE